MTIGNGVLFALRAHVRTRRPRSQLETTDYYVGGFSISAYEERSFIYLRARSARKDREAARVG
jgi:hypothetical protein